MLEVRSGLYPFVKVKKDQLPGEDVRLKRVDVHADSNRSPGANPVDQNHLEICFACQLVGVPQRMLQSMVIALKDKVRMYLAF